MPKLRSSESHDKRIARRRFFQPLETQSGLPHIPPFSLPLHRSATLPLELVEKPEDEERVEQRYVGLLKKLHSFGFGMPHLSHAGVVIYGPRNRETTAVLNATTGMHVKGPAPVGLATKVDPPLMTFVTTHASMRTGVTHQKSAPALRIAQENLAAPQSWPPGCNE